jgi:hypothetical protein
VVKGVGWILIFLVDKHDSDFSSFSLVVPLMEESLMMQVSNDFDDGENVYPNTPHLLFEFDMSQTYPKWPRAYVITIILAEEDHGGFGDFMQRTWNKVGDQVTAKIRELAAKGIDKWTGTEFGTTLSPYIGEVIDGILDRYVDLTWFAIPSSGFAISFRFNERTSEAS